MLTRTLRRGAGLSTQPRRDSARFSGCVFMVFAEILALDFSYCSLRFPNIFQVILYIFLTNANDEACIFMQREEVSAGFISVP